jgi:AhpD family alkylhydroperoxidase
MKETINEKTQELIALGASIAAQCQPCLKHHVAKARELGLGDEEIQQAMEIGRMVKLAAASAFREYEKQATAQAQAGGESCCKKGSGCC